MHLSEPGDELLIPPLPTGAFVNAPEEIDRFLVCLWPDGSLSFTGSRPRIAEFLHLCEREGLPIRVDHISRCG